MMIIGCDFHPSWQQVSWLDSETGDCGERKLVHADGDAKMFYQQLAAPVLIGMEATGNSQWFVELVEGLGHEGHPLCWWCQRDQKVDPPHRVTRTAHDKIADGQGVGLRGAHSSKTATSGAASVVVIRGTSAHLWASPPGHQTEITKGGERVGA